MPNEVTIAAREAGRGVQVVADAGREVAEGDPLAGGAGDDHDQLALQVDCSVWISWSRSVSMCAAVPSVRPRATIESLRVERRLAERVGDDGVGGLVDGDQPALLAREDVLLGGAGDDAVDRLLERCLVDLALRRARSAAPPR